MKKFNDHFMKMFLVNPTHLNDWTRAERFVLKIGGIWHEVMFVMMEGDGRKAICYVS